MARVRLKGKIQHYYIGLTSDSKIDLAANVLFVRWSDRSDRVSASIVANTVLPVGWHQGHREGKLELGILSEAEDVFDQGGTGKEFIDVDDDNYIIGYHYFTLEDHLGAYKYIQVYGSIVDHVKYDTQALEEMVTVYHMKYYYATSLTTVS